MVDDGPRGGRPRSPFPPSEFDLGDGLGIAESVFSEGDKELIRAAARALRMSEAIEEDEEELIGRVKDDDWLKAELDRDLWLDSIVLRSERPVFAVQQGSFDVNERSTRSIA